MEGFREYFRDRMEKLLEFTQRPPYYLKAKRRYRDTLSLVYPVLKEGGKSVLDVGGWEMAFLCAPLAASVRGISIGAPGEAIEKQLGVRVDGYNIMAADFPLEGNRYDVVFFLEILEHLPPPTDMVMKRIHGLVQPGGLLLMSVPNLAFWQKRLKFFFLGRSPLKLADQRDPSGVYHHIRTYTYAECVTLLKRYGFRIRACRSGNYQRGWYHFLFRLLERVFRRSAHKLIFLAQSTEPAEPGARERAPQACV